VILVDTSCWVEFYRRGGDAGVRARVAKAVQGLQAATCTIVQAEFLAYVVDPEEQDKVDYAFSALHLLPLGQDECARAVALGRLLRTHGLTIAASDLLVAAVALEHEATLYHTDDHFVRIAEHTDLDQRHLRA